jgi:hypothetical protein
MLHIKLRPSRYLTTGTAQLAFQNKPADYPLSNIVTHQNPNPLQEKYVRFSTYGKMASAATVHVTRSDGGVFNNGLRDDSAQAATRLLQENHKKFHMYFNEQGFHSEYFF